MAVIFDDVALLIAQAFSASESLYERLGLYREQALLETFIEKVVGRDGENFLGYVVKVSGREVLDNLELALGNQFSTKIPNRTACGIRDGMVQCSI